MLAAGGGMPCPDVDVDEEPGCAITYRGPHYHLLLLVFANALPVFLPSLSLSIFCGSFCFTFYSIFIFAL